jgi:hypothetical protein
LNLWTTKNSRINWYVFLNEKKNLLIFDVENWLWHRVSFFKKWIYPEIL